MSTAPLLNESGDTAAPASLSRAMRELENAMATGCAGDIALHLERLEGATPDAKPAHAQLCQAGALALRAGSAELAERFAKRTLLAFPKYGQAYRLLGDMFGQLGKPDDAAPCYRFELPTVLRDRWFDDDDCVFVDSRVTDGAGLRHLPAFASEHYSLDPPQQSSPVAVPDLDHDALEASEAFVGVVPHGRLWYDGGNAIVWDRHGRIVADLGMGYAPLVQASVVDRTPVKLAGRVCLLGNRSWQNYYHWMCDSMPRLDVLEAAGIDLDTVDRFVTMPLTQPFHSDSLARAGLDEARLHTTQQGQYIEADELLVPVFGSNSLGMSQGSWMPRLLAQRFGTAPPPSNRWSRLRAGLRWPGRQARQMRTAPERHRLFVSRGATGKRGIANEQELLEALKPLGFRTVHCETLSIAEQATLFESADVVLGPHGAGLTNTVFCQPGTLVVELFNAHMAACFWTISELSGLQHALHYCAPESAVAAPTGSNPGQSVEAVNVRALPFHVDVAALLHALDGWGVGRQAARSRSSGNSSASPASSRASAASVSSGRPNR